LGEIPRDVFIRVTTPQETRRSRLIPGVPRRGVWNIASEEPAGAPSSDETVEARRLSYQLPAVRESLSYHFEGGDNRSRSFAVRVHDRPSIALVALTIEPPAYTKEPAGTIEGVRGEIRAPIGAVLRFRATSDEVIRGARYRLDDGEPVAIAAGDDPNSIEW